MTDQIDHHGQTQRVERLPAWWRYVLVATATVLLSSCSAPLMESHAAPPTVATPDSHALTVSHAELPVGAHASCPTCNPGSVAEASGSGVVPASAVDPYGPLVGPSDEYLCDGGDFGTPVGVRADWSIAGLDEEDAVGHYDTVDGRLIVTPSNRVCIYAPRFAAVRRVVNLVVHEQPQFISEMREEVVPVRADESLPVVTSKQRHALAVNFGQRPPSLFRQRQQAGGLENLQATMDAYTSLAAYANLEIIRTGEASAAEEAALEKAVQSAITLTGVQAPQVLFGVKMAQGMVGIRQAGVIYQTDEPNHPRLRLIKLASRGHALPGEEIEFTLRFDNIGDQVIGNVTIVDNLSTRLEYIPESATSSVDANFLTESNDTGSLILRWEIKDPVEPGEGGILRFRVKVR